MTKLLWLIFGSSKKEFHGIDSVWKDMFALDSWLTLEWISLIVSERDKECNSALPQISFVIHFVFLGEF